MTLPLGIRGRLVALALLVIPLILVLRYAVWPAADAWMSLEDELAETRLQIDHYRRLLAQMPALREATAELERTRPLSALLLSGDNRALAAADLQRSLQRAVEEHGATMLSLRVKPTASQGALERIAVEARLRADVRQLRDLLYYVESSTPYLFVDNLSINVRTARRRNPGNDLLDVNLTVFGLRQPEALEAGGVRDG
jgi:general secretion pathway protein M